MNPLLPFEQWLPDFLAFREKARKHLCMNISAEVPVLQKDSQELEPLRWEAEDFRAGAVSHYYRAKLKAAERLLEGWTDTEGTKHGGGWPRSSIYEAAKAQAYRELWAREAAEGLCRVIESRGFKVAQALKLLDDKR